MKLELELDLSNAAFENPEEIYKIFNSIGHLLADFPKLYQDGYFKKKILDTNGNTVGELKVFYESKSLRI